jgi:hypothetical protein
MTNEQLQLIISAKDMVSPVMSQVSGKMEQLQSTSQSLASQGLGAVNSAVSKTADVIKTGLVVGLTSAVGILGVLGHSAINNAAQFEQYRATLTTMLGSQELANARLKEYSDIASKTPFELPQIVELGNQLQAIGKYSKDNVNMLGDLASAAGKPIEQVSSAFSKLATGQKGVAVDMFRDLLITTDDWVKATGKGISKSGELLATTEEMMAVLPKIMQDKKFTGMMAQQSETFLGKMSNLADSWNTKLREVGEQILPHIKPYLDQLINFISSIDIGSAISSVTNLFNLLFKGEYTGGIFGLEEDDPLIEFVLGIKDVFGSLYEVGKLLFTGDYTGGIFGFSEDDVLITNILTIRDNFNFLKDKAIELFTYFDQNVKPIIVSLVDQGLKKLSEEIERLHLNQIPNLRNELQKWTDWYNQNKAWIDNFAVVIAGIASGFVLVYTALAVYNAVMTIATAVSTFFGIAVAIATSPIFLIALAIGAVIAIGFLLWKNWDWLSQKAGEFSGYMSQKWQEIKEGIQNAWGGAIQFVKDHWLDIIGYFSGVSLFSIGVNLVKGLINGLDNQMEWLRGKIQELANMLPQEVRQLLNINSPSRVMMEIGGHVVTGLANGIDNKSQLIIGQSENLAQAIVSPYSSGQLNTSNQTTNNRGGDIHIHMPDTAIFMNDQALSDFVRKAKNIFVREGFNVNSI